MLDTSRIYESNNFGRFRVVNYHSRNKVDVVFIETGYRTTTYAGSIRKGLVKDLLAPSVHGVGYIGEGPHAPTIKGKGTKAYQTWVGMIRRCYYPKSQVENPCYLDCSVCHEWLNFQVFAEWFELNYIEGLHLDKDIMEKGNKVYCAEFCTFVTPAANSIEANAKHYSFISPEGELTEIYNLNKFCRDNGLTHSSMSLVHAGKRSHHKRWTKAK